MPYFAKREGIMLCYPTTEHRLRNLGSQFLAQPKLNGERAHIVWQGEEPLFISSYGNEFKFLNHLKSAMLLLREKYGPLPLDGEIYVHGWPRERIDSALRRKVNESEETPLLQYHVFDLKVENDTIERLGMLYDLTEDKNIFNPDFPVKIVPSYRADQTSWLDYATTFTEDGYEGIILRKATGSPWLPKRTVNMLKFKPTEKDEYIIIGVLEAISQDGFPKAMIGSFIVKAPNVEEAFSVSAGKLKHNEREYLWKNRGELIGKRLLVKHEPISTAKGIPNCCVAVEVKL